MLNLRDVFEQELHRIWLKQQFMLPYYRRSVKIARDHGIDIHWLDCDGNIMELIPLWLDCGINCHLPLKVDVGMVWLASASNSSGNC